MRYNAVLFDLDGVICHTDAYHYKAWKRLADKLGIPFDETVNNRLRGVSRMQSLAIILEKYTGPPLSDEKKLQLADEKNTLYRSMLQTMGEKDLAPPVQSTLLALRSAGYKLAIASSSRNAPLILERLGLAGFFDAVVDGNGITHSKPHPEVFLKAAKALGEKPAACLVVEDAAAGVQAAVAGGFDVAAVGDAAQDKRATYMLGAVEDLRPILLGPATGG